MLNTHMKGASYKSKAIKTFHTFFVEFPLWLKVLSALYFHALLSLDWLWHTHRVDHWVLLWRVAQASESRWKIDLLMDRLNLASGSLWANFLRNLSTSASPWQRDLSSLKINEILMTWCSSFSHFQVFIVVNAILLFCDCTKRK